MQANPGKKLEIHTNFGTYARIPIKTHVITNKDDIAGVVEKYAKESLSGDDIVFISERTVAITQGRAILIKDICPSRLARFLTKFVHKSEYGIGLGIPETMQLAIKEVGVSRILFAAFCAAITKPLGIKGVFYRIAGKKAAAIDGPCSYTLPPYNKYATLAPENPNRVSKELKQKIGHDVVIIDANDLGVDVLGIASDNITKHQAKEIFRDNPLGQSGEQTPLCIVRKI